MADVAYVSRVRVKPVEGKVRLAHIPAEEEPVVFGVHSEVAEHYGVSLDEEAMNMIRFQRAFEAGARIIRVTDELLQTVLEL